LYQQILLLIALWEGGVVPANPAVDCTVGGWCCTSKSFIWNFSVCPGEEYGTGSGGDSHAGAEGEPDSLAHAQHITSSKLRRTSILEQ